MSVAEQRYKAVLAVIADGRTVKEVARDWGVSRQTLHAWLARYEKEGLEKRSTAARASSKNAAGIGRSSRHVTCIGLSPSWRT